MSEQMLIQSGLFIFAWVVIFGGISLFFRFKRYFIAVETERSSIIGGWKLHPTEARKARTVRYTYMIFIVLAALSTVIFVVWSVFQAYR